MFLSTIILAAGKGSRMKSPLPKVLHQVAGKSLIQFSLDLSIELNSNQVIPPPSLVALGTCFTPNVLNPSSAIQAPSKNV